VYSKEDFEMARSLAENASIERQNLSKQRLLIQKILSKLSRDLLNATGTQHLLTLSPLIKGSTTPHKSAKKKTQSKSPKSPVPYQNDEIVRLLLYLSTNYLSI
jgi:hypothetical protein